MWYSALTVEITVDWRLCECYTFVYRKRINDIVRSTNRKTILAKCFLISHITDISKESRQNLSLCLVVIYLYKPLTYSVETTLHTVSLIDPFTFIITVGITVVSLFQPPWRQSFVFIKVLNLDVWTTWLHDWTSAQKLHRSFRNSDIFVQQQMTAESVSSLGYRGRWFVMTDPMLTGNPAIVTIEGSLRIIDLYEKVFYSCISRLLVLWDFLLKTIGLIKKIVKNKRIKMSTTENF